ncbi:MAG: FUSC family protein [Microbacterium sp.]|uniref:FUSC family protein n=1 Tax=Microbacterium sp. TaxID=51671 RepID=UPI0039E409C2
MSRPGPETTTVPVRVRDRLDPRPGLRRARESVPAVIQIVIAATAAYAFAHFVLGHAAPVLAGTVAVSSLGLVRDARPRRVIETVVGMMLGVLISEGVVWAIGSGWWQLPIVLALVLLVARTISSQPAFAIAAAVQGLIVMLFPTAGTVAVLARPLDGLVGGASAILMTVVVPRNLRGELLREARALFASAERAVTASAEGLARGDRRHAERGLDRARRLDLLVRAWQESLESATAVARISPFLRRRRAELERQRRVLAAMDLAVRNLRVVGRRAAYLVDDGRRRPIAADVLAGLGRGMALIGQSLEDISLEPAARDLLRPIAAHLDPARMLPDASLGEQSLVSAMRPLAVDLLTAAGMPAAEARDAVPRI